MDFKQCRLGASWLQLPQHLKFVESVLVQGQTASFAINICHLSVRSDRGFDIRYLTTLVLSVLLAGQAGSTLAADRNDDIVNKTGKSLTHFYASRVGANNWEKDILGQDTLDSGEIFSINIDDGTGACRFDFRAVFRDGGELVKNNINVCEISTFTYRP